MQSWGTRSRFSERDTELEPSKSAVVGLICAAIGRRRDEDVSDLAALHLGVRVDKEGVVARDYHTAGGGVDGGVARASGSLSTNAVLSNRYYLADADFLVGLEGDDGSLLRSIDEALRAPHWQISLGRKSFVPSLPVYLPDGGLRPASLEDALRAEPWPMPCAQPARDSVDSARLRLVVETSFELPGHEVRMDQPVGPAFRDRTFGPRAVSQSFFVKERTDVPQPANP